MCNYRCSIIGKTIIRPESKNVSKEYNESLHERTELNGLNRLKQYETLVKDARNDITNGIIVSTQGGAFRFRNDDGNLSASVYPDPLQAELGYRSEHGILDNFLPVSFSVDQMSNQEYSIDHNTDELVKKVKDMMDKFGPLIDKEKFMEKLKLSINGVNTDESIR